MSSIAATGPYNVLILKSDEHNPFVASTMGHPFIVTPNLDRLARLGTTFESCYCPSPLCTPSRSSYLTGRSVHDIQVYNNCLSIPRPQFPTYGGVLDKQGVYAVHVGKVDAHRPPDELGFSEMRGHMFRGTNPDIYLRRNSVPVRPARQRATQYGPRHDDVEAMGRHATEDMDYGISFLLERARDLDQPWTMEINLDPPHFPHHVTPELWNLYDGHADLPKHGTEVPSAQHPYAADLRHHFDTETMAPVAAAHRRAYYGRITWVDRQLGRLLDALQTTGLLRTTIVGYTSDHGEMLGQFGMWWKCSMFESSVRVPLVLAGPGFTPGARVTTPVSQWDLQATIFHTTRATRPSDWLGRPLQDINPGDQTRAVFAEYSGHGTRASAFLVRRGPWKLIWNADAPHQLFHLDSDPDELTNVAAANPHIMSELTACLREEFCDPAREQDRAESFITAQIGALEAEGIRVP